MAICECDQACCEWCEIHGATGHRNKMYDMPWGLSFAIVRPVADEGAP